MVIGLISCKGEDDPVEVEHEPIIESRINLDLERDIHDSARYNCQETLSGMINLWFHPVNDSGFIMKQGFKYFTPSASLRCMVYIHDITGLHYQLTSEVSG